MALIERPYQSQLEHDVEAAWTRVRGVVMVAATGSGKTFTFCRIIERRAWATPATPYAVVLAHRQELVGQSSLALARNGIRHRIIAPDSTRSDIEGLHMLELGRRFVDQHAQVVVAGVHTIVNRQADWMKACGLVVVDEGHHLLRENIWGRAVAMLPNAKILAPTATPVRADGKGLGSHAHGMCDEIVQAPGMRALITAGFLCDYEIYAPPGNLDLTGVGIGAGGDFISEKLRDAVHRSTITGDIVKHYLRLASGKRGITFTVDVADAEIVSQKYRDAGVPAEAISAKTPTVWRAKVMRALRAGELLQVCNCDLLGEGADIPAVEVVSMGRPTMSFGLFTQQFGRPLRPLEGKSRALIIDHAGNTMRHGLPDAHRVWTLDARDRQARSTSADVMPITTCPKCSGAYERVNRRCPYCKHESVPQGRTAPIYVDGDLALLDEATLKRMRGELDLTDAAWHGGSAPTNIVEASMKKNHNLRQDAQENLRHALALWGGWRRLEGDDESTRDRRFFLMFGVDKLTAQSLGRPDAETLRVKVIEAIDRHGARYPALPMQLETGT